MPRTSAQVGQKLKVLIVEDEALIARDIQNLLTDWGYQVADVAASAPEAIEIFRNQTPDLALVDVQLDDNTDGVEAVRIFNDIRRVPVIYLTAQADARTVERAKSTKPAAYLLKPFDERHLQISLDLAFANFYETGASPEPKPVFAHEVKLNGEVILKKDNEVFIKQNYRFVKFDSCQVVCLEADRTHTFIHTVDQKFVVRIPLTTVLERLDDPCMVRVHRSFAININMVDAFSDSEITVHGKVVPYSVSFRDDFFKNFNVV